MKLFYSSSNIKYMSFAIDPAKRKPRLLTVTESCRYYPRITISGSWMRDWGFSVMDRVFLLKVFNGEALIRIGTPLEQSDVSKYCRQQGALADFPIRDAPSYYLSNSRDQFPEIIITGAWLRDWGFTTGDRISLTWMEEGHMLMKMVMPRWEWRKILQKRKLEHNAKIALAALRSHQSVHPDLYDAVLQSVENRKQKTPEKSSRQRLFDEVIPPRPAYCTSAAARSANTPGRLAERTPNAAKTPNLKFSKYERQDPYDPGLASE